MSNYSKKGAVTNTAHRKLLIELLKKLLTSALSTIWESTDGCAEQYRCASELYLMPVLSQCWSILFYLDIIAPGHGKDVVDGINDIDKCYIYQFMSNNKLPGSKTFDSQIIMNSCTENNDFSLAKQLQSI